jgi:hypothetical protein
MDSSIPVTIDRDCPRSISLWAALRRQTKTPNPSCCLRVDFAGLCNRCISIWIIFWNRFGVYFRFGKQPLRASRVFCRWSTYLGSRNYSGRMANPAFAARPPVLTDAIQSEALPHAALTCGKHNPPAPNRSPISLMNIQLRARQRSRARPPGIIRHPEQGQAAKRQTLALGGNSPPDRICTGVQSKRTKHPRRIDVHASRELSGRRAAADRTKPSSSSTRTAVAPEHGCESDNKGTARSLPFLV